MIMTIIKNVGKMAAALLLFVAVSVVSMLAACLIFDFKSGFPDMVNNTMNSSFGHALQSVLSIGMVIGIIIFIVKKKVISADLLGLDEPCGKAAGKLGLGFIGGAAAVIAEIMIICAVNNSRISVFSSGTAAVASVICGIVIYASVGLLEEVLFRGFYQGLFGERKVLGIAVTALLFAAMHLVNSAYSTASLIYLIAGGLFFSLFREVTGSLWACIGFHTAWDWVELSVFGLNEESGNHWLFVGADELVSIVVCAALMGILSVVMLIIYCNRQR